ncbi:MAG: prenyltransferase, partial [Chloroflexi bacterium]
TLTPLVKYYLQASRLDPLPMLAVTPLCCLQFAQMLSIEFPDAAGDAAVGKRTLVVRLGGARAAWLYGMALLTAYTVLPLLVRIGLPALVAGTISLTAPLAVRQGWRMLQGAWREPAQWNSLAFWSIALLMSTAISELAAFLWLA